MVEQNHECYVSLEVAKLLKEAGFDWSCRGYYDRQTLRFNFVWDHNGKGASTQCSAPTLDVAQRWLREVKLYNVLVDTGGYENYEYFIDYHGVKEGPKYPFHEYNHDFICKTYEEALEAGIKKALEMILEKGE